MYEFHGWFTLSDSTRETNSDRVMEVVRELEEVAASFVWPNVLIELQMLNGEGFLTVTGRLNRRREESTAVWELIELAAKRLPGSAGLVYERDDEATEPPGGNAYKVTVLTRGRFTVRKDPFLSPCNPVIED